MKNPKGCDYSLSLIRLIATVFIVTCHIMQYLKMELAWWLNVGVQIFLCLSGYLYGMRATVEDDWKFYRKNFIKILVDYYVVMIPAIFLYAAFSPNHISKKLIVHIFLTSGMPKGGEHLWYISYCLFCYLITPFLGSYFDHCKTKHTGWYFLALSAVMLPVMDLFFGYFNFIWIFCYVIGFYLGRISGEDKKNLYKRTSCIIIAGAVLTNSVQIAVDYIVKLELTESHTVMYTRFCNFAHVALGVSLFLILKYVFSTVFHDHYPESVKKLCSCSDRYSYDIYLVHQFVILGPFSMMEITGSLGINIMLILLTVAAGAVLVNYISARIKRTVMCMVDGK